MATLMSSGLYRAHRSIGRTFATAEAADAYDDGLADYQAHKELPPREPPLTPAQAAYRAGWYDGERRFFDSVPDGPDGE